MNTIVAILRAAHCKSVHHFFAIDALCEVLTPNGQQLANLLLAHYQEYLRGAKDPDTVFKDFENHVVHVADGYWGGAAKAANQWLTKAYQQLQAKDWPKAAYSIGVLSHYVSDPFMPLHTAQSPRETTLHRPLEWSVCCAYQELYDRACQRSDIPEFELPHGETWLTDLIHLGARASHRHYEAILDDYDINESRRFPALALGRSSKEILSEIFAWVITAWGNVLERIADESNVDIPAMSLKLPTLMAGVQVPAKRIVQSIESAEQRKEIERIFEEYQATGQVVRNIPLEQRVVKKIRLEQPNLKPTPTEVSRAEQMESPIATVQRKVTQPRVVTPPATFKPPVVVVNTASAVPPRRQEPNLSSAAAPIQPIDEPIVKQTPKPIDPPAVPQTASPQKRPVNAQAESTPSSQRPSIHLDSPIVDAPAIGPKTAARFQAIGVHTIGEFLDYEPEALVNKLKTTWINAKLVKQWQAQSRLAVGVERLSAAGAGLLVMIEIETPEELAACDAREVYAQLLEVAQTNEAKRLLRDKGAPPLPTIERWIESARQKNPASFRAKGA